MASVDVAVIGAGLAGAVTARRLVENGARVLLVEGGRAVSAPPGSHVRNVPPLSEEPDGYFAGIDAYVDYLDLEAAPEHLPGAFTTTADGGMGVVWTNNCPCSVPGVDRPRLVPDEDWERYYPLAEAYLGVTTDEVDDSRRQHRIADHLGPTLAWAGRELRRLPLAGHRTGPGRFHYVGPADVLEPVADRVALTRGRVESLDHHHHRVDAVVVDGRRHPVDAAVVAAGAIESPRLLARSGLGGPAVGTHLSYHPVLFGQVVLDDDLCPPGPDPDAPPRLCVPPTPGHPWFVMVLRDTNPLPPAPPDEHVDANRLVEIQVFSPVDPHPDNRMTLTGPVPEFTVPLREADEDRRRAIERDARDICRELGRFRAGCEAQWAPLGTPHLMGSCRMGEDPDESVVDPAGRVWDGANTYIVGNAVIPTALAVNPTLTAAALAVRTADHITGHVRG